MQQAWACQLFKVIERQHQLIEVVAVYRAVVKASSSNKVPGQPCLHVFLRCVGKFPKPAGMFSSTRLLPVRKVA